MFLGGNANPFDPAHTIAPGTDFEAVVVLAGVHKVLPVAGRSSTLSLFLPVGHLQGEITGLPLSLPSQASRGFGDPVLQMTLNVAGAPAIRNLMELGRYEPKFTIDALGAVAFPVGEHQDDQLINLGQNRWYGRIGAPMMVALAPWVPGRRTTVEAVPAVWFFQDV